MQMLSNLYMDLFSNPNKLTQLKKFVHCHSWLPRETWCKLAFRLYNQRSKCMILCIRPSNSLIVLGNLIELYKYQIGDLLLQSYLFYVSVVIVHHKTIEFLFRCEMCTNYYNNRRYSTLRHPNSLYLIMFTHYVPTCDVYKHHD